MRITQKDLEALCRRINRTINGTDETPLWTREDGDLRQSPGVYYIDGAYSGVALFRTCDLDDSGESHGVSDVFQSGHMPKRELYGRMSAFLDDVEAGRADIRF